MDDRDLNWRDGRAVEGAALEMLFRGNFNEGSNPSLSVPKAPPRRCFLWQTIGVGILNSGDYSYRLSSPLLPTS